MLAWLGVVLVPAMIGPWTLHSHQLAWPSYAVPCAVLVHAALRGAPFFSWMAAACLLATLVARRSRLRREFQPGFFPAVGSLPRRGDRLYNSWLYYWVAWADV